jgi:hypothetical protein
MDAKRLLEIEQLFLAGFYNEAKAASFLIAEGCSQSETQNLLKKWDEELHPSFVQKKGEKRA